MNRRDFLKGGLGGIIGAFLTWAGAVRAEEPTPEAVTLTDNEKRRAFEGSLLDHFSEEGSVSYLLSLPLAGMRAYWPMYDRMASWDDDVWSYSLACQEIQTHDHALTFSEIADRVSSPESCIPEFVIKDVYGDRIEGFNVTMIYDPDTEMATLELGESNG